MTNHRANPSGWTDLDPTDGKVLAKQMNTIDRGIAGGLDSRGGTVTPAQELRIKDFGTSKLLDSYARGKLSRSASGRFRKRLDRTTIQNTAAWQYLDTTSDIYWNGTAHVTIWTIFLVTTSSNGQVPALDDVIEVACTGDGGMVLFYSEGTSGGILTFPAARILQASDTPFYGKFRFDGTVWEVIDCSADAALPP